MYARQWTGRETKLLRYALRLTIAEFAEHLGVTTRAVDKWEARGTSITPRPEIQRALDTVLSGADAAVHAQLIPRGDDAHADGRRTTGHGVRISSALWDQAPGVSRTQGETAVALDIREDDTKRREFLRLGRDLGLTYLTSSLVQESEELRDALSPDTVSEAFLFHLETEAADIGFRILRIPHLLLLERALAHGRMVRQLMPEAHRSAHRRRLERLASQFALAVGEILFMEGLFSQAHSWYSVARAAAGESGDQNLLDVAIASNAYLPSYSDNPQGVLDLVVPRLEQRSGSGSGTAWLWAFRAKAEACLGLSAEHSRSIDQSRECLEGTEPESVLPSIFSFTHARLAFYETSGHGRLGQLEQATTSAATALELYDHSDTSERALVRLAYASALVDSGETDEACGVAVAAVIDPGTSSCSTVLKSALDLDRLIGGRRSAQVNQWREALQVYGGGGDNRIRNETNLTTLQRNGEGHARSTT